MSRVAEGLLVFVACAGARLITSDWREALPRGELGCMEQRAEAEAMSRDGMGCMAWGDEFAAVGVMHGVCMHATSLPRNHTLHLSARIPEAPADSASDFSYLLGLNC
jgi:hypothetical protein